MIHGADSLSISDSRSSAAAFWSLAARILWDAWQRSPVVPLSPLEWPHCQVEPSEDDVQLGEDVFGYDPDRLDAALERLQTTVREIRRDVKTLLGAPA